MAANEEATVRDLKAHQAVILPMIAEHGGHIIDTAGDGVLAKFGSVINAVECTLAIQTTMVERNTNVDPERHICFRIGVNLGDVIHDEVRVYGDGVNIAARLEVIARPGGTCISGEAFGHVRRKLASGLGKGLTARLVKIDPAVRISTLKNVLGPSRRPEYPAKYAAALRKTGLPV